MTGPSPRSALVADDRLLDRLAGRRPVGEDAVGAMLLALAVACDRPLAARLPGLRRPHRRRRAFMALASLGLAVSGAGMAAALGAPPGQPAVGSPAVGSPAVGRRPAAAPVARVALGAPQGRTAVGPGPGRGASPAVPPLPAPAAAAGRPASTTSRAGEARRSAPQAGQGLWAGQEPERADPVEVLKGTVRDPTPATPEPGPVAGPGSPRLRQ